MADERELPRLLLLDACCAIDLLATGVAEEILRSLPFHVCVTPRVLEEEVLFVRDEVTLQPLVASGALIVAGPLSDDELETFVSLALELDDGEAETAAAAIHRGGGVATDDRKAIRVLRGSAPDVAIHRTSSLVRAWADARPVPDERVRDVLLAIQRQARFVPPRDDPEREWWVGIVGAAGG